MTFLMSDADEVSEAAVLALAETIFVEFSKTAELLSDKQKITQVEKCHRLQLEGQERYEFNFVIETLSDNEKAFSDDKKSISVGENSTKKVAIFSQHTPEEFELKLLDQNDNEYTAVTEHYFNEEHEHGDDVSSVAIELSGLFDFSKINAWLDMFLQVKGTDIYRMKGVVGVKGESHQIVFQGIHMMLDSQVGKPWGDEQPVNRMVFIGKDLDESYIQRSLKTCLN
jgi:G3E family GTPase